MQNQLYHLFVYKTTSDSPIAKIRNGLTFLDLTVRQIEFLNTKHGADVPLVLMNSIHTDEKTRKALAKYKTHNLTVHRFVQVCDMPP